MCICAVYNTDTRHRVINSDCRVHAAMQVFRNVYTFGIRVSIWNYYFNRFEHTASNLHLNNQYTWVYYSSIRLLVIFSSIIKLYKIIRIRVYS